MSLVHFTFATRSDCHYARRIACVNLRGSFRVPFFRLYLQDNVGRGEKHHIASDDRRTLPARRKSCDPPALRSVREIIGYQPLVRPKIASEDDNLIDPVVPPIYWRRPSILILRAIGLPDGLAVAAVDAEQVGVFPLMVEHKQVAGDNW